MRIIGSSSKRSAISSTGHGAAISWCWIEKDSPIPLIKRVIGLPGEKVEIRNNTLYIDAVITEEPYLAQQFQRDYGPITVPPLHILVMGDNRMVSHDSRAFGPVPIEDIRGRAWVRVWPFDQAGVLE